METPVTHFKGAFLTCGILLTAAILTQGAPHDSLSNSRYVGPNLDHPADASATRQPDPFFGGFATAVQKVSPAVVRIVTVSYNNNLSGYSVGGAHNGPRNYVSGQELQPGPVQSALGSGVIVTEDGSILTSGHLLAGAVKIEVTLPDGRGFAAKIIGLDAQTDIAVIQIDAHHLPTVAFGDSRAVQVVISFSPSAILSASAKP